MSVIQKKSIPSTNRSKSTSKPLYTLKDTFMCLFCGGKKCKHENYKNHPNPAINGLNCDQIDENIFASQRPSNILIEQFDLITQFKKKKIGMIVNVQRPGEHPYCGPNGGLDIPSGYTYSPSLFTSEGIKVKLCGWKDMNVPDSFSSMLEIVKDMAEVIIKKHKKVLVHCNAGYGRTGITIASYKMYSEHITAEQAVKEIRAIRSKCVQSSGQMKYCQLFYKYLMQLREIFKDEKTLIALYLKNQNDLDVGKYIEYPYNKYVPLMFIYIFNHILSLRDRKIVNDITIIKALNGTFAIKDNIETYLSPLMNNINNGNWYVIKSYEDVNLLTELLYKWMNHNVKHCINIENIDKLFSIGEFNLNSEESIKIVEKTLTRYEIEIIKYISDFVSHFNDEDLYGDICLMREKLCIYLFGYSIDEENNDKISTNVERLIQLMDYFKKYTKIAMDMSNQSEDVFIDNQENEKALHDVYMVLSNYFNNNNELKGSQNTMRTNISKGSNPILNSINNMINGMKKSTIKENEELNINLYKSEQFKLPRLGTVVQNDNKASSQLKMRSTINMNISNNQSLKVSEIIHKESTLSKPWLKEEDC